MRVADLVFIKFLRQSDIIHLVNYLDENKEVFEREEVEETKFLFDFFKQKYKVDFNPIIVLKYIYMYLPKKYIGVSTMKLSLSMSEMTQYVEKFNKAYKVESIGADPIFEKIESLKFFRQIKTRQEVWDEIIKTNVFIDAYRFWQPSWVFRRAIFCYENGDDYFVLAVRKAGYKIIISEIKSAKLDCINLEIINKFQDLIDSASKEWKYLSLN